MSIRLLCHSVVSSRLLGGLLPGHLVSVVIPALDEERAVAAAVRSAAAADEVLVVDGGSTDATRRVAEAEGARVLAAERGRGRQMDTGARVAVGAWLVFLHADTRLEEGWRAALEALPAGVAGGAFRFAVDSPRFAFRVLEAGVRARGRLLRLPYGDQALFARRAAYEAAGGFPPLPILEDLAFVRRLRGQGRFALLRPRAFTSARRWERHGLVRTSLLHAWILARYALGWSPEDLAGSREGPR